MGTHPARMGTELVWTFGTTSELLIGIARTALLWTCCVGRQWLEGAEVADKLIQLG